MWDFSECVIVIVIVNGITKKVCVNYEEIIREVARSAGYDSGLDWRAMNVIVATEEETLDVTQTLMLAEPSDNARARSFVCGNATDDTPLGETGISAGLIPAAMSESLLNTKKTSEGAVVPEDVRFNSVSDRHGIDVKTDQLDKDVRPVSLLYRQTHFFFECVTWMQSNSVEANFRVHHGFTFGMRFFWSKTDFPGTPPRTYPKSCGRLKQLISSKKKKKTSATTTSSRSLWK